MTSYARIEADARRSIEGLAAAIPDTVGSFFQMHGAANKDGALDPKTKELIALASGIAARCDGCVAWHAKAVQELGATREEVAEMIGIAVQMGGGPSLYYGSGALEAYDEFAAAGAKAAATG